MIRRLASLSCAFLIALAPASPAATKQSSTKKSTSSSTSSSKSSSKTAPKKTTSPAKKSESEAVEAYPASEENGVPKIRAKSAIVIDANTGRVLHEVNADSQRPVASTQKLLTALIVAEAGGLDTPVEVEASDTWAEPSKLYIKAGDVYRRGDLLRRNFRPASLRADPSGEEHE